MATPFKRGMPLRYHTADMNWIVSAVLCLALAPAALAEPLARGDIAPNWVLMNRSGEAVSLYQIVDGGTPAIMVFCASWCERCKTLLPQIKTMMDGHRAEVLMLNVWEDGDPSSLVGERTPEAELMLQADAVARRFEIAITPGIVVVDRHRRIVYKPENTADVTALARELKQVLAEL